MACLFALPITHKRSSRFSKFVSNLLVTANDGDFRGLTKFKLNVLLVLTGFITITNSTCLVFLDFYQNTSVASFRPWNGLLAIRLLNASFNVFNSFAWVMPIFLFGVSSSMLSRMLDGFQKKASTENPSSLNIGSLRKEHQKLCETVALADKVFSPYLFVTLSLHIRLICINFHQLVRSKNPSEGNAIFLFTVLCWWLGLSTGLAVIFMLGIRVNEKKISASDCKEHLELLHFMTHLRGEPIGISVRGLVVINKSLLLSVVGIIISYLAVLLTLPT